MSAHGIEVEQYKPTYYKFHEPLFFIPAAGVGLHGIVNVKKLNNVP